MQLLKTSWNRSLAASLLVALTTTAHADEPASAQDDDAVAIEAASGEATSEAVATAEDFDIPAIPSGVDDLVTPESNEAVADDFDVSKPSQETRITRERRQLQRRLQEIQERLAALDREQLLAKSKRRTKSILKRPRFKLPKSRLTAADVNVVSRPLPADEFGGAYVPANPATMQFVVGSKRGYEIVSSGMRRGTRPYADRTYKVMRVDRAFASLPFLQTLNSDKGIESSRFSTVLTTEEACYVFLAIDERAIEYYDTNGTPSWLNEYAPTGHTIDLNEEYMQRFGNKFIIFARKAPAGTISLGPPGMNAATNSMYFAFFASAK